MSDEKSLLEQLEEIEEEELETITIEEVRELRPKIFEESKPFVFVVGEIGKAKVRKNIKTRVGSGDMYILDTMPKIYTFANGYDQLVIFCKENKVKKGDTLKFVRKYIPEGKDSFATTYEFEKVS